MPRCEDDYAIKYIGKEHALHLLHTLQKDYKVTTDWSGTRYIGITLDLDWDYKRRQVHLSMPRYVAKALKQFNYPKPKRNQNAPFPSEPIKSGTKHQYAKTTSSSPPLRTQPTQSACAERPPTVTK